MQDDEVERYRGRWVALDDSDDHVVADADSLEALLADLDRQSERRVLIQRIPSLDDPLFIGLG